MLISKEFNVLISLPFFLTILRWDKKIIDLDMLNNIFTTASCALKGWWTLWYIAQLLILRIKNISSCSFYTSIFLTLMSSIQVKKNQISQWRGLKTLSLSCTTRNTPLFYWDLTIFKYDVLLTWSPIYDWSGLWTDVLSIFSFHMYEHHVEMLVKKRATRYILIHPQRCWPYF